MESDLLEQEEYEVRIGAFNGPMDLLVYLVQKKEVPLEQISIAEIADQFLKWVNAYSESASMDLSKAGDFLSMASRLMALKVQELLPAEERDPEMEAEYNEDREQLMKEMLEYQRFKQVASGLQEMEEKNFGTFSRGRLEKTQSDEETLADANIWQLFRAYQKSLKTKISETIHHIELDYVTIQDRQQAINNYLSVNGRALFEDLLDNDSHPIVAAVTFMAMLEMIKTDEIVFRQSELFGPIWIYRKKNNSEFADEMARETVFFSKDPDVKPGLVEAIRNQAIARSKEQTVGDLAAVMREAVQWTNNGRNVSEDDLTAMLEGKVDMSDVQENPFAEMLKADDAAEGQAAGTTTDNAPAESQASTQIAEGTAAVETSADKTAVEESTVEETSVKESDTEKFEADKNINVSETEDSASEEEPVNELLAEFADSEEFDDEDEFNEDEFEESDELEEDEESSDEDEPPTVIITAEDSDEDSSSDNEPSANQASAEPQMSDEEFAEFMRKAQEFYNNGGSASKTPKTPTPATSEPKATETPSTKIDSSADKIKTDSAKDDDGPIFAGNEMTDDEYIAYLTRSAKNFGKKD